MQQEENNRATPRTILVIEDEDLLREYLCDFLKDADFVTLQAPNGKIGIEMVRVQHPDLVITDLRMPELNGLELLAIMKREFPEIPVIVLSGTGTLADVVHSLKNGAWDYILKPLHDYKILQLSVDRVFERKQLLDENRRYHEHLEEEVVRRSNQLINSTLRFETLFNNVIDAIFIISRDGIILDVNQRAIAFSGYTTEELTVLQFHKLFASEQRTIIDDAFKRIEIDDSAMFEVDHIRRDDTCIPVEINASTIKMEDTPCVLAVCRDISERKKAEEERKQLEKQLITAQKMESLGLLASGIAHDFNNILTALKGYAILLEPESGKENVENEYLTRINEIVSMGQKLTQRITTFIRKDREELKRISVHSILSDTDALLRTSVGEMAIEMTLNAVDADILGDESQLQNAFLNLGINARDAMPGGGGVLQFTTENGVMPGTGGAVRSICITVKDTGTGMSAETMSRIFDPLFTTKEKGKGTGLGLTSVLYCINNLHGHIRVDSTPGAGTEYTIHLPVVI